MKAKPTIVIVLAGLSLGLCLWLALSQSSQPQRPFADRPAEGAATQPGGTQPAVTSGPSQDTPLDADELALRIEHFKAAMKEQGNGINPEWLSSSDVVGINFGKIIGAATLRVLGDRQRRVQSREEATKYIHTTLNIPGSKLFAYEDKNYYYFSGGTIARMIRDFSYGIAVEKATGKIYEWQNLPPK
jgi:hypothetical protein